MTTSTAKVTSSSPNHVYAVKDKAGGGKVPLLHLAAYDRRSRLWFEVCNRVESSRLVALPDGKAQDLVCLGNEST